MNSKGTLQENFPLSPRKFWKKIITQVIAYFFALSLFLIVSFIIMLLFKKQNVEILMCGAALFLFSLRRCLGSIFNKLIYFSFIALPCGIFESMKSSPLYANDFFNLASFSLLSSSLFFFVMLLLYAWYVKIYINRYSYEATENAIMIQKGVFAPTQINILYSKIQDVYVDQDFLDRCMGLYDVHLASATAASEMEAHIDGVEKIAAEGLKNILLQKFETKNSMISPNTISSPAGATETPFEKEISSKTYPLSCFYFLSAAVRTLVGSALIAGGICLWAYLNDNHHDFFPFNTTTWELIFGSLFLLCYLGFFLRDTFTYLSYFFEFTPNYIVMKKGVFTKTETHLPYRSIQDVSLSQGIIERLCGIATIRIQNAATSSSAQSALNAFTIPAQPLARANEIKTELNRIILAQRPSQTEL